MPFLTCGIFNFHSWCPAVGVEHETGHLSQPSSIQCGHRYPRAFPDTGYGSIYILISLIGYGHRCLKSNMDTNIN